MQRIIVEEVEEIEEEELINNPNPFIIENENDEILSSSGFESFFLLSFIPKDRDFLNLFFYTSKFSKINL